MSTIVDAAEASAKAFEESADVIGIDSEGSLVGVYGPPGTGKSVLVTVEARKLVSAGKVFRIVTNSPLIPAMWAVPIHFLSNKDISNVGLSDKSPVKLMPGDLLLVDEVHLVWDAMRFKEVKGETDLMDWVSQARKLGVHFVVVSQAYEDFVVFIRRRLQRIWSCSRLWCLLSARCFEGRPDKIGSAFGMPKFWFTFAPPKEVAYFNSRQRVGIGPGVPVNVDRRGWKWVWIAGLFVALVFGMMAWRFGWLYKVLYRGGGVTNSVGPVAVPATNPGGGVIHPPKRIESGDYYDRSKARFFSIRGRPVDPLSGVRYGLNGTEDADFGVQWDAVERQATNAGGGLVGAVTGLSQ